MRAILFGMILFFTQAVSALTLDLYHSPTCMHCHKAMDFIEGTLKKKYPKVRVRKHNVFMKDASNKMMSEVRRLSLRGRGVPLMVIKDDYIQGFGSPQTTGVQLEELVKFHLSGKKKR